MLGAIIGDIVGSVYEFNNIKTKDFPLFSKKSEPTDDSIMTLAVCEAIQKGYADEPKRIVETLKKWGRLYPNAGYGGRFINWIFSDNGEPYNSCGNGSAMRISAAGWYGRDEEEVKELAHNLTAVTHNHPEGLKGAEVTAMCIYYARIGKSKEFIKEYVSQYYDLNFDYEELRRTYIHAEEICQVTVPQAIFCFLISTDFEDCLRTTISIGGDCDTTAAISCAIAEAYYKDIDAELIEDVLDILECYDIEGNIFNVLNEFIKHKSFALANSEIISDKTKVIGIEEHIGSKTSISFIHSTSKRVLMEYIVWFSMWATDKELTPCEFYLNEADVMNKIMKVEETNEFIKRLNDFEVNQTKYIYFETIEDAIDYLNDNYDLNNKHLNNIFEKEYRK